MGFDITKIKTAEGKPISLDGVDEKVVGVINALGSALSEQVEASSTATTEAVNAAVTAALEPVTTKLAEIEKVKPTGKPDDKPTGTPDDQPPTWAADLIETVNGLKSEREAEKQQGTVASMVKGYLDKNLPNLGDARAVIERRLIAAAPKDEAAIKAGVEEIRDEFKAFGAEVTKQYDAKPESEGAKEEPKDDKEREKAEKMELLGKTKPLVRLTG